MTTAASGLVAFGAPHVNRGTLSRSRPPVDESLVSSGEITAPNANGVELVDLFGDGEELRDGAEGLSSEVHVRSRHDDSDPPICQSIGHLNHPQVQELGLVDGDDFNTIGHGLGNLNGVGHGNGFGLVSVMGADCEDSPIAVIKVGLEDLDPLLGDEGSPDPPEEFFRFSAEHHARHNLDPTVLGTMIHEEEGGPFSGE